MAQFMYFAAMLVLFESGNSLETTTSPQEQSTATTKDLCEVQSFLSITCYKEIPLIEYDL